MSRLDSSVLKMRRFEMGFKFLCRIETLLTQLKMLTLKLTISKAADGEKATMLECSVWIGVANG
jgi:hypothetical protein